MIAIKDVKMPRGCYECQFADESIRMDCDYYCQAVKEKPDVHYGFNRPDWCPLVDVPDMNIGKCSEIPNNSDCVSRRTAIEKLKREFNETDVPDRYPGVFDAIEEWLSECELPSAQPETAKRIVGKSKDGMTLWYQCDMCYEPVDVQDNFCRGCGRRLIDE